MVGVRNKLLTTTLKQPKTKCMMKRYLMYVGLCFLMFLGSRCSVYQDASTPPKSSLTVDKTSGLSEDDTFTFTVTGVTADAVALLPMGEGTEGVLVSGFTNGSATVKYTYPQAGNFNAVVVTSNFSPDGKSVKRTVSAATAMTITSHHSSISDFSLDESSSTVIKDKDKTNSDTILVTVPYNPWFANADGKHDIKAAVASFDASAHSTVTVGSTAQSSGSTANDFSSVVSYTVTAFDGTSKSTYLVYVTTTAVDTDNTVKSAKVKVASYLAKDKSYDAYVDNAAGNIIVVLPPSAAGKVDIWADSLKLNVTLNSSLATSTFGTTKFHQDTLIDLSSAHSQVLTVKAQSGATKNYSVVTVSAPGISASWPDLAPVVSSTTADFLVTLTALKGTDLTSLDTDFALVVPTGSTVTSDVTIGNINQGNNLPTPAPTSTTVTISTDTNSPTLVSGLNYSNQGFPGDSDPTHNVGSYLPVTFNVTATIGAKTYPYVASFNVTAAIAK
jgi:hypothetical protein